MTLPSYGIPSPEASFAALPEVVSAVDQGLHNIGMAAMQPLIGYIAAVDQNMGVMGASAIKSLARKSGYYTTQSNNLSNALAGYLGGQLGSIGAQLDEMNAPALTMGSLQRHNWAVMLDCDNRMAALVPYEYPGSLDEAARLGWVQASGIGILRDMSPDEASNWLATRKDELLRQCISGLVG